MRHRRNGGQNHNTVDKLPVTKQTDIHTNRKPFKSIYKKDQY